MIQDFPVEPRIKHSEIVFSGMIWDVAREQFEYLDGQLTREFVKHPGAVAVVALNENEEVLLIRQYRHPVRARLWEIPAGLKDVVGEDALATAQRELLEETGYRANRIEPMISFHTTPGGNDETIEIFLAQELEYVGHEIQLDGEEVDMETRWVPLTDCIGQILASKLRSPSLVVGLLALAAAKQARL